MKLSCRREDLLTAVQIAGQSVPKRHVNETLDNRFLFRGTQGVSVSATDYNIYVEYSLTEGSYEIEEGGELLLPLDKMVQLLRESRDEWVVLDQFEPGSCRIGFSDGHFDLLVGDPAEFPASPRSEKGPEFALSKSILIEAMDKGRVARATEEGRYLFDHILIQAEDDRFAIVTTDGRRMALYEGKTEGTLSEPVRILASPQVLQQARKLCERSTQEVRIRAAKGKVFFETERGRVVATTRDEGSFPDYRPHMDKPRNQRATLERAALLSATKRISLLTSEQERAVEFRLIAGELVLRCRSGSSGSGEVRVGADYEGEELLVNFDPVYVAESLQVMNEDQVELRFENPRDGAIIQEGERYKYLVMPILLEAGATG